VSAQATQHYVAGNVLPAGFGLSGTDIEFKYLACVLPTVGIIPPRWNRCFAAICAFFGLIISSFDLARRQRLALAKDRSTEMRKSYVTKLLYGSFTDYFCCPPPRRRRPFRTVCIYNACFDGLRCYFADELS
jgi:hypothetical protein